MRWNVGSQESGPQLLDMENVARAVGKVLMSGKIRARAYTVRDLWIGRQLSYKDVQVPLPASFLCLLGYFSSCNTM